MTTLDDENFVPLLEQLDLAQKVALLTGKDSWSLIPIPRIGLRSIVLSDGPAGVRGDSWDERSPSINFPSPTAVAASWDSSVVERLGSNLGSEARRKNVDVILAPTINLHRTPYGGRHFEAFSEDPFLTARLATSYVRGIQSQGVGATVKHYVANDSETDRFTVDVRADDRTLRELYLLAFEQPVVEGPAWLVMSAYNSINGHTATENELLVTPLSDEWGFDGVVVSDWTAVRSVESAHYPQDLAMPGPVGAWGDALIEAVRAGNVLEKEIDRKVVRILRLAARVGALEGFEPAPRAKPADIAQSLRTARTVAAEGSVLLVNRNTLPLASPGSIAVIGEGARWARTQGGGSATVVPSMTISPLEGITNRWPQSRITWTRGSVVQSGLADLDPRAFESPDGQRGMHVRYLDENDEVVAEERREASKIVSFDAAALATRAAVVEMRLTYRPGTDGDSAPFGVAGLSDYEILADGSTVAAGALRTSAGDDPATAVLSPPYVFHTVPLTAGAVNLTVRFTPVSGGIPGALALGLGTPPVNDAAADLIAEATEAARASEIAVVVVSTSAEVESEGFDRTSLALPSNQDELVRAVAAANPRTIVVVNSGSPVTMPWRHDVAAILAVWFPGQEFGHALADVLSGDTEPGGRLPVTWPSTEDDVPVHTVQPVEGRLDYSEGIHIGYRAWLRSDVVPAFAFGHGLGYTTWRMDELHAPTSTGNGESTEVFVTISNTGARLGKAVVQLYLERVSPSIVDRPAKWLAGFAPVRAEPNEAATISIQLDWRRFAHWSGEWTSEPGEYILRAGFSSHDLRAETPILIS